MSTISFPDWINSLSPQSTDGKEVYQQDGSTPSRGDLDDKASLSGANFTDMPNVDGVPIVESGSNSDGEFVRFGDGTQECTGDVSLSTSFSSQVAEYTASVPKSFNGSYEVFLTGAFLAGGNYANRDRIEWYTVSRDSRSGSSFILAVRHGSTALGTGGNRVQFHMKGRWY